MIKKGRIIRGFNKSGSRFTKTKIMFIIPFFLISFFVMSQNNAPEEKKLNYLTKENISCYSSDESATDGYIAERCKLDIYYPADIKNFTTVVWCHGGGINSGNKHIPKKLKEITPCQNENKSTDLINWEKLLKKPFLPNGKPGEWNSSESGLAEIQNRFA